MTKFAKILLALFLAVAPLPAFAADSVAPGAPQVVPTTPQSAVPVQVQTAWDAAPTQTVTVGPQRVAPPSGGVINIGAAFGDWLQPYINALIEAALTGLGSWVLWVLKTKFNITIDAQQADAVRKAVTTQANALVAGGLVKMQGLTVTVDNAALADAANRILANVPDAVEHFGLTPDQLQDKLVAMIPQTPVGSAIVANAHGVAPAPMVAAPAPALPVAA